MDKKVAVFAAVLVLITFTLRFWHLDYGLPYVYFPDEADITDPVIKIIDGYKSKDINILKPASFIYGTVPTYFLAFSMIITGKLATILKNDIPFGDYVVWIRGLNAFVSVIIPIMSAFLYFLLFRNKYGSILTLFLTALNWKLIFHAHYVNQDNFVTVTTIGALLFTTLYLKNRKLTALTLAAVCMGLSVGTKVTAILALPALIAVLIKQKDRKQAAMFFGIALITFLLSNPFTVLNLDAFTHRILGMYSREAGVVFSSVDISPFKYIESLSYLLTLPILLFAIFGILISVKGSESKNTHALLLSIILIYFVFFSIQSRRVDRWMLPVIPLLLVYASSGIFEFYKYSYIKNYLKIFILIGVFSLYGVMTSIEAAQLAVPNPRAAAYKWFSENADINEHQSKRVLVYTEDGRDPFNKSRNTDVILFKVYESNGANAFYPVETENYEWIVISSKTFDSFKNNYVMEKYPGYSARWLSFEDELHSKYYLTKSFNMREPNLLNVPSIAIYNKK